MLIPEAESTDATPEPPPIEKPADKFDELFPEPSAAPSMPPEPTPEMQGVAYGPVAGKKSNTSSEVHITRIKIPLGDAIRLIITFWFATLVIGAALAIAWLTFLFLLS